MRRSGESSVFEFMEDFQPSNTFKFILKISSVYISIIVGVTHKSHKGGKRLHLKSHGFCDFLVSESQESHTTAMGSLCEESHRKVTLKAR